MAAAPVKVAGGAAVVALEAAVVAAATAVLKVEEEVVVTTAAAEVAGPSQSQWSPWALQPTELVGEGPGPAAVPVLEACDDDEDDDMGDAELVTTGATVGLGPVQSQWSP